MGIIPPSFPKSTNACISRAYPNVPEATRIGFANFRRFSSTPRRDNQQVPVLDVVRRDCNCGNCGAVGASHEPPGIFENSLATFEEPGTRYEPFRKPPAARSRPTVIVAMPPALSNVAVLMTALSSLAAGMPLFGRWPCSRAAERQRAGARRFAQCWSGFVACRRAAVDAMPIDPKRSATLLRRQLSRAHSVRRKRQRLCQEIRRRLTSGRDHFGLVQPVRPPLDGGAGAGEAAHARFSQDRASLHNLRPLDHSAVSPVRSGRVGHVEVPNAFPDFGNVPQAFRNVD